MCKINRFNIVTLLVVLIITSLVYISVDVFAADTINKKRWMADDSVFESPLGTRMNGTIDGLTFNSGVIRDASNKVYKGDTLYNYFYMPNYGSTTEGSIKFDVYGDSDIYIIGNSNSNGEERELAIYSTATQKEECIKINGPDGYKYKYKGGAGSIYVYAKSMPIRIYGLGFRKTGYRDNTNSSVNKSLHGAMKEFSSNRSITSTQTVKGYTFFADETNKMHIDYNGIKDDSYRTYDYVLKTEGSGYVNKYRCIGVYPDTNSDIYITARSSNHESNRGLLITNEFYETICDNIVVTATPKTYKIEYSGYDDCLFLKSLNNGLDIYNVTLLNRMHNIDGDSVWNFGANFANQTFTKFAGINSLYIFPNIRTVTIADSKFMNYTKVLTLPALNNYNRSSRLQFNVSDSSGQEGETAPRKIVVTAKAENNNVNLVLANEAGYVYGVKEMNPSQSTYVFDYNGTGEALNLYGIAKYGEDVVNIYRIATNDNLEMVKTGSKTITVKNGVTYPLYFTAEKIKNTNDYTYYIKYDKNVLSVESVEFTDETYNYVNNGIKYTDRNGLLTFTRSREDENWSGLFTVVKFKAKADGNATLTFAANYNK